MLSLQNFANRNGSYYTIALIGEQIAFEEANRYGLTVTVVSQPAGSSVTITDGATGSTTNALTVAGRYEFSATSTVLGGYAVRVFAHVWPAAVVNDGGPLSLKTQGGAPYNTTTPAERRRVLHALALDIVPTAAASLFVANGFPEALIGRSAVETLNLARYGL